MTTSAPAGRGTPARHNLPGEVASFVGRYVLDLAEAAEPRLMSRDRGPWMERLATDQDNLRSALAWSRRAAETSDREVGLRLAGALLFFWTLWGEVSEGLDWVEAALVRAQDAAPAVRAKALYAAAELAWLLRSGRAGAGARRRAKRSGGRSGTSAGSPIPCNRSRWRPIIPGRVRRWRRAYGFSRR